MHFVHSQKHLSLWLLLQLNSGPVHHTTAWGNQFNVCQKIELGPSTSLTPKHLPWGGGSQREMVQVPSVRSQRSEGTATIQPQLEADGSANPSLCPLLGARQRPRRVKCQHLLAHNCVPAHNSMPQKGRAPCLGLSLTHREAGGSPVALNLSPCTQVVLTFCPSASSALSRGRRGVPKLWGSSTD